MKSILRLFVAVFGIVCCLIALSHIVVGTATIPGGGVVNATMDSEVRFYSCMFFGFGAALVWCSRDLRARIELFNSLLAVFFFGGLARIVSAVQVGPPNRVFVLLGLIELVLPPLLWWWCKESVVERIGQHGGGRS